MYCRPLVHGQCHWMKAEALLAGKANSDLSPGPPGFTKCSQMPAFKRLAGFYPPVIALSHAEARVSFASHIARNREPIKTAWLMLICSLQKAGRVHNFPCDFFSCFFFFPETHLTLDKFIYRGLFTCAGQFLKKGAQSLLQSFFKKSL